MDALIYSAMSGAERTLHAQQVRANNLANAATNGFRADLELARSQSVQGYGYSARHLAELQANAVSTRSGTLTATGRDLDAAVSGDGFFAVALGDGEGYTRNGAFVVDANGALMLNGRPVLGDGGPIVLPAHVRVAISENGTVSVQPEGEADLQPVDRLKLVKPEAATLAKNTAGFVVSRDGQPLPADDTVRVRGAHLEGSNVSAVEEMVASMGLSRDFEVHMRLFKVADDMAANGNRLLRE
ncbi:flagellar basal-body rod protein FlgF [Acidovorax soli]|jgi:flagellar basal-body rod protein FlgF|uniref:Flagellar basal-body rod protein FlgF n=1 Tax=Acidovorax soli TaxID=592050 RepID=A0A7X0UBN4_9BURK|nr:flagellar basal body rod protein FlgF [Acidovorax soli]MBB6562532.1 flagellar basal-body rod protein FlgF [Acidovorax soli]